MAEHRQESYEWINDNTGALKCAGNRKHDSEASQYACLEITQLHQRARISIRETTHRAGIDMGENDTMSRIHDNENPIDVVVQAGGALSKQTATKQVLAISTHRGIKNIVPTRTNTTLIITPHT